MPIIIRRINFPTGVVINRVHDSQDYFNEVEASIIKTIKDYT